MRIYGFLRTMIKYFGRANTVIKLPNFSQKKNISIVGCGQFAFSTISYFLYFSNKNFFLSCFDIDIFKSKKLQRFYGFLEVSKSFQNIIDNKNCKLIYIASNHHSHTDYAIASINKGIDVYIEKPISVNFDQLKRLEIAANNSNSKVYVGYNRPHSKAIRKFATYVRDKPFSINCFVSGHFIQSDHWYREPKEGTRICGNMGHWIDLGIHLFGLRSVMPEFYDISVIQANINEPDDNINVSIRSSLNDLLSITLASRNEPFEGINETINILHDSIICKIDDFRKMEILDEEMKYSFKYFPKDVGHKAAILQPFEDENKRSFSEIIISTRLMIHIKEMVIENINYKRIIT
jgi:predicted dehydrogenase